jgi:hypothetical protein
MAFYGIDLHSDSFVAATMTCDSKIKTNKFYLDQGSFQKFKEQLTKDDYVLVEACTNSFWFYDQIVNVRRQIVAKDKVKLFFNSFIGFAAN